MVPFYLADGQPENSAKDAKIHFRTRAHMLCPNKKFKTNSKTFQKILKQFGDEHIRIFYIHDKFRGEMPILLHKKTKSVL